MATTLSSEPGSDLGPAPFASAGRPHDPSTVRMVIADANPLFRDGLNALFATRPKFRIIGEAVDNNSAIALIHHLHPDILLLDLSLPPVDGMDVLTAVSKLPVRTILLATTLTRLELVRALQLGVRGFVFKSWPFAKLLAGLTQVLGGGYWIREECLSLLVDTLKTVPPRRLTSTTNSLGLTTRELEVMLEVAAGFPNHDIAMNLSISEQTVKHHLTSIYSKVGLFNRVELALFAAHNRLANPDSFSARWARTPSKEHDSLFRADTATHNPLSAMEEDRQSLPVFRRYHPQLAPPI